MTTTRPRLVATDLDGTLLRSDGTVSERTARVLADLERIGVHVVFVTGRPLRWMEVVRAHVGPHGLAICSNGGVVVDLPTDRVTLSRPIDVDVAITVTRDIRSALPGVRFAVEGRGGFAMEPDFPTLFARPPGTPIGPIEHLVQDEPVKLLVRDPDTDPDAFLDAVDAVVAGRVTSTRSGAAALVEISAAGVTKASTLALVCDRFGIAPKDVVAFGDMPNDLPMLEWAGRSFAVAGAHPSLASVVSDHASSNDQDGVAVALEQLFGL